METSLNLATSAAMSPVIGLGILHLSAVLGGAPARLWAWANIVCVTKVEDKTAVNRMVNSKRLDLIALILAHPPGLRAPRLQATFLARQWLCSWVPPPPVIPINKDFRCKHPNGLVHMDLSIEL